MGTKRQDVRGMSFSGLSPRVRGNHTGVGLHDGLLALGLSPRVRGNRREVLMKVYPRRAGEPS